MQYLDFDLQIDPGNGRNYPVSVRSPVGEAHSTMYFPFDTLELENYLTKLENALLRSGERHRQVLLPNQQAVQDFGMRLFEALFAGEVGQRYAVSRERAIQQHLGVRLRLRIQAPELITLPWEYLYDKNENEYVCLSRYTPLVRYVEMPHPIIPLTVHPPLRILGMIASPSDQDALDIVREQERMSQALHDYESQGLVQLTWLNGQTWRDVQHALQRGPWHVFHFIGHGGFDRTTNEGVLALANEHGKTHLLHASHLALLLSNHGYVRLAVLNACDGAKSGERDVFSSTAAILARRGIPAVLAMQEEITDNAAIECTRSFYAALANGLPVDAAVAEARTAISVGITNTLEWGTPVLYLRAPDGVLFTLSNIPSPPSSAPAQVRNAPGTGTVDRMAASMALAEAGDYAQALTLLRQLQQEGNQEHPFDLSTIIEKIRTLQAVDQQRSDAWRAYDEIKTLALIDTERAKAAWQSFLKTYPEFKDDPAKLAAKLEVRSSSDLTEDHLSLRIQEVIGEPFAWCKIPAGAFLFGDGKKSVNLSEFCISKYLVTYDQFQRFIEASDGFHDPRWWAGLAANTAHRSQPGDQTWKISNHPREQVSWYEAIAFCRWLSCRLNGGYDLGQPEKWLVRLPNEHEWEKAARGTDGRMYPWDDKYKIGHANVDESNLRDGQRIGRTTPVTSYPQGMSPYGVLDMSGNVWEWTLTDYNSGDNSNLNTNKGRIFRGGSFADLRNLARTSARGGDYPYIRSSRCGFRIVHSSLSASIL